MNNTLKDLIEDYHSKIRQAMMLMQTHLGLQPPQDQLEWLMESGIPPQGYFGHTQQYHYWLHGTGCNVEIDGLIVSWDFDLLGEWQGIDPWKLSEFVEFNRLNYPDFAEPEAIIAELDRALSRGEIESRHGLYYLKTSGFYPF